MKSTYSHPCLRVEKLNETSTVVWLCDTDSPMLEKYALELKLKENTIYSMTYN